MSKQEIGRTVVCRIGRHQIIKDVWRRASPRGGLRVDWIVETDGERGATAFDTLREAREELAHLSDEDVPLHQRQCAKAAAITEANNRTSEAGLPTYGELLEALRGMAVCAEPRGDAEQQDLFDMRRGLLKRQCEKTRALLARIPGGAA